MPNSFFELGVDAAKDRRWSTALEFFRQALSREDDDIATLHNAALSAWRLGRLVEAEQYLSRAAARAPDDADLVGFLEEVRAWRRCCAELSQHHPVHWSNDGLLLTPLGPHHADALLEEMSDPGLAWLARLPQLTHIDEAARWIDAQRARKNQASFAIMDAEAGFIGVGLLRWAAAAGYIVFWIGRRHQGRGRGRRSVAMLVDIGERALRLQHIIAIVLKENARSLALLASLDFAPLSLQVAAADGNDDLILLARPAGGGEALRMLPGRAPLGPSLRRLEAAVGAPGLFD